VDVKLLTIGVYGSTADDFFSALRDAGVDTFVDIRQRRGVRGSEYAFVNSSRLQARLREMGIRYVHIKELAPSKQIREMQKLDDERSGGQKRARSQLGPVFAAEYKRRCLEGYDIGTFSAAVGTDAHKVALFCVEGPPEACHRSLAAAHLSAELDAEVEHIRP
jgi:uncharacterized protein (DUF488 family)